MKCPKCGHAFTPIPSMAGMPGVYMRMLCRQLLSHKGDEINAREISLLIHEMSFDGVHAYDFNGPRTFLKAVGAICHPAQVGRRSVRCKWVMDRPLLERLLEEST